MKRHEVMDLNKDTIDDFFKNAGKYPGKEATKEGLSPIWNKVFSKYGMDIFDLLEAQDSVALVKAYSNYYANGISDGACAGRKLESFFHRLKYTIRNKRRLKLAYSCFLSDSNGCDISNTLNEHEIIRLIYSKFSISSKINIGRPYGWNYDSIFFHAELTDHIYFANFILSVSNAFNCRSVGYLGDGSGILSSVVNSNAHNLNKRVYIDLAQYLLRQYIVNDVSKTDQFIYAESFDRSQIDNIDLLVNQDSFPEIPEETLDEYFQLIDEGKIKYVLSYNHENYNDGHSDYRSLLIKHGMSSVFRTCSTLRKNYVIELFCVKHND